MSNQNHEVIFAIVNAGFAEEAMNIRMLAIGMQGSHQHSRHASRTMHTKSST